MRARVRGALSAGLIAHAPHFALLGALLVAALALLDETDERLTLRIGILIGYWATLLPFFLAAAAAVGFLRLRTLGRRGRPLLWTLRWLAPPRWPEILLLRLPLALGLTASISYLYFTFKVNIPRFAPFAWDDVFAAADRALFLGHDPWTISHALLPWARATQLLDAIYLAWYLVLFAAILAVGVLPLRHPLRLAFLLAIALDWVIGGVVIATLVPAAGPVYLERVSGDPTFRPMMDLLAAQGGQVPIMALRIQEWLWTGYATAGVDPAGISAFPSLHVAIPATCACLAFVADRMIGWILAAFTVAVLVGSVHLGWHYAIDGFGGLALGLACWWASRRLVAWWLRRTEPWMAGAIGHRLAAK
ncbi:MAG TPA: phosphatase PAP2 family protein [Thermohalobaculum sp.]|nr:phosphatase PAP2 family protein [Thermohalobaculum sp.]